MKKDIPPKPPAITTNGNGSILTDPLGSYTGIPVVPVEEPVQDADDL